MATHSVRSAPSVRTAQSVHAAPTGRSRGRALALGTIGSGLAGAMTAALIRMMWRDWQQPGLTRGPSDAVELCALLLACVVAAWLTLVLVVATAGVLPGAAGGWSRRRAAQLAPVIAVRLTALLLGTSALGLSGAPAWASGVSAPAPITMSSTAAPTTPHILGDPHGAPPVADDLPEPTFTSASEPVRAPGSDALPDPGWRPSVGDVKRSARSDIALLSTTPTEHTRPPVVVHRGDSLWQIAQRQLGPDATPSEIARAWPRWYAANRAVIGDDPDLLLPGQVLTVPETPDGQAPAAAAGTEASR